MTLARNTAVAAAAVTTPLQKFIPLYAKLHSVLHNTKKHTTKNYKV